MAQNVPSAEQLQIFQGLSPEQQKAVLQQVGVGAAGEGSTTSDERNTAEPGDERRRQATADHKLDVPAGLSPGDTVVVEVALPGTMARGSSRDINSQDPNADTAPRRLRLPPDTAPTAVELRRWTNVIEQINSRNPYVLDRDGYLNLPGFAPILVAGLSDQQAVQLLASGSALRELDLSLSRLPVARVGTQRLKPYGYEQFNDALSDFSSSADQAVPADYVVGPGDQLNIQLFGGQNRNLRLIVSRDGAISFPELGPISVGGQRFSVAKSNIEARVARQMLGVRANVSMGDARSIRVFVAGEVLRPGSYTVSGFATMTRALFDSGGVTSIGSLRDIQLKRRGTVVRSFDLYDMLMRGDTSNDAELQAGDVIFIPPVGPTVSIDGEVKRPAIYELKGETTAEALLQMAGGLAKEADPQRSSIVRIDEQFRRIVLDVDFASVAGRGQLLRPNDELRVARLRPQLDSGVTLEGFVHRPGPVAWRPGLRLTDVIASVDELKPNADTHYIVIRRETGADRKVEIRSADLVAALAQRGGAADIALSPRDRIIAFDLATGRERIVKPLLDEMRLQSGLERPTEVVRIEGRVKFSGEYPLEPGMTVSDLLRAGGNPEAAAFGGKADLARYEVDANGARQTELIEINLAGVLQGDAAADLALRPFDYLLIKETPDWSDQESVTLSGEVRYPGVYVIRRNETLHDVLQRAGGLTSRAFINGSVFTRVELREREQTQLNLLAERMQSDLAAMSVQAAAANQAAASQSLAAGQSLLAQLKQSRAVGRLVIDLPSLLSGEHGGAADVILRNGDQLIVPPQKQEVTVIGEVQTTTSHLYTKSLRRSDYISMSGGTTRKADLSKIYVVRADGSVIAQRRSMLVRSHEVTIQPGDTIVVPMNAERMPRLPFWQAVTQIVYNLAVSVAAVNSF